MYRLFINQMFKYELLPFLPNVRLFFSLDTFSNICYFETMTTTDKLLEITYENNTVSKKQANESSKELNNAIFTLSSLVEDIGESKEKICLREGLCYEEVISGNKDGAMHMTLFSLYGVTMLSFGNQIAEQQFINNIWINIVNIIMVTIFHCWFSATHVDVFKMQERIEKKGKISAIRLLTMRLFTTKKQWKMITDASAEANRYNKAQEAWEDYKQEVFYSDEFENALKIVNDNSPRKEIYRTNGGGLHSQLRPKYRSSVTESNLLEWIEK